MKEWIRVSMYVADGSRIVQQCGGSSTSNSRKLGRAKNNRKEVFGMQFTLGDMMRNFSSL